MNSENIETIFTNYLKTPNTQFAILLNGSWGCGKTYFWKYRLNKIVENEGFKPLYLSLNGLSKIETIEYQFFIQLIPFIGKKQSKIAKNAISIITNILNGISKSVIKLRLNEIFKDVDLEAFNFEKYVICFDDLERCQIPIKEMLGFINNYVEHKNLKTIILSDETNIDSSQEGYNNIKEKVIGRILNFELNIGSTLPLLFKKYELINNSFYTFLINRQTYIGDILKEYEQVNLRIIFFYLDTLEKLFPYMVNVSDEYASEVIFFSALISFEFKLGNLKSSEYNKHNLDDLLTVHYSYAINHSKTTNIQDNETEKISYAQSFYIKYLQKRINEYIFYPSIYNYILTGYLNETDFRIEIKNRHPELLSDEIKSLHKLNNFRELSNTDFSLLTPKIFDYAEQGAYPIYSYAHLTDLYLYFSDNGLSDYTKKYILQGIESGLQIAKNKKQINEYELENLLHFKNTNSEVERIKQVIKEIHFGIKEEQFKHYNQVLIDSLYNPNPLILIEFFKKHRLSKDLFPYMEFDSCFVALKNSTNGRLTEFTNLLRERYKASNIGDFLSVDYDFLKKLEDRIKFDLAKNDVGQPQKFLFESLVIFLNEICIKLNPK